MEKEPADEIKERLGERVRISWDLTLSQKLISKFPFNFGRIDWTCVPEHICLASSSDRRFDTNESDKPFPPPAGVLAFLDKNLTTAERADSWVAYIGDNMTEEYEVERSALPEFLQIVASLPDHKYIFSLDASWCLMWSMEDQLYFGMAPARLPRRRG